MPGIRSRVLLFVFAAALSSLTPGCLLVRHGFQNAFAFSMFWKTTPVIPVSAYFSQEIEDTYWEEERYGKVPILDPVEGENAPLFCLDPPSKDEVMRSLPDKAQGGFAFLSETFRDNVRIVIEPIVDRLDECRFYPLVGPARLHHCHYKCTVYYDKTIRSTWPVPFTHTDQTTDVVYIDHDHLIRCAGPATPR
ncbi:MAG: hypothetical protein D6725_08255 [Planctomycetota bacterium]|nr:MAG: hypothetical protein D6725_08255 [Planctomycetota bacterium]